MGRGLQLQHQSHAHVSDPRKSRLEGNHRTSGREKKGPENKNDGWNLGQLFGGKHKDVENTKSQLTRKRRNDLRAQMRTWIVRRERNGVLRCRMLPLRPSLAFNAPFDIVLRHRCFKYGNEDKVLEFFALCASQGVNGVG